LSGGRWRLAKPAVLWAVLAGAAAVPLFWATPRTGSQWELGINSRGRAVTGLSEGPVDLNTTGPVTVNRERAFEVYVEDEAGRPYLELAPDQRWRVYAVQNYEAGRWGKTQFGFETVDRADRPTLPSVDPRRKLPNLGPQTIYLSFSIDAKLNRHPPLADPVAWRSGETAPAVSRIEDGTYRSWLHRRDGAFEGSLSLNPSRPTYMQAWTPADPPGAGPAMRLQPSQMEQLIRPGRGLPRLKRFTDQLIERLVGSGVLPHDVLMDVDPITLARAPRHHEAIARALEHHLSSSGEFSYTLDLTRKDKTIDPAEDFVLNTKAGHCQRFAAALVLMLRTQGIPSQMVVGYRGSESRGDGWYDVREDHAHAWAEVLIPASDDDLPPVWTMAPALGMESHL